MKGIKRISAGVMFESDVLNYINFLAAEFQRNRSFIINQIIRQWMIQQQQQQVEKAQADKETVLIHF